MEAKKSIAIVGCSVPSQDDTFRMDWNEVWAINNALVSTDGPAPDLIIAMDDLERDEEVNSRYVEGIVNSGCPVITTRHFDKWPTTVAYPLKEVLSILPTISSTRKTLLLNTVNYALAYAIYLGAGRIGLFGCDFSMKDDDWLLDYALKAWTRKYPNPPDWFKYYHESTLERRAALEPGENATAFLIGFARGKGIEIVIPPTSTLLDHGRGARSPARLPEPPQDDPPRRQRQGHPGGVRSVQGGAPQLPPRHQQRVVPAPSRILGICKVRLRSGPLA